MSVLLKVIMVFVCSKYPNSHSHAKLVDMMLNFENQVISAAAGRLAATMISDASAASMAVTLRLMRSPQLGGSQNAENPIKFNRTCTAMYHRAYGCQLRATVILYIKTGQSSSGCTPARGTCLYTSPRGSSSRIPSRS